MTDRTGRFAAILAACFLVVSAVAPAMAATAGGSAGVGEGIDAQPRANAEFAGASAGTPAAGDIQAEAPDEQGVEVGPHVANASGTVEVVVRLEEAKTAFSTDRLSTMSTLKTQAERTQRDLVAFAHEQPGVDVLNTFWVTNAVLLEVDTDRVDLQSIAAVDGVRNLHANFDVNVGPARPPVAQDASSNAEDLPPPFEMENGFNVTYGLEQVNATSVWNETMGGGVKVAVLDTGVNASHADIDLFTTNASDPTYPGGWAEFNTEGDRVMDGEGPSDAGYHGTHTSGTVSGGNASGTWIGVAPNVSLLHGQVLGPEGGTFGAVVGGIEWAMENNADVISMSLGPSGGGFMPNMIEPLQNAEDAGVLVSASAGNGGSGTSGTPGNAYESVAAGATDWNYNITDFSSGEVVDTSADWGGDAPADWPETYVVPDVSAPGHYVESSVPKGSISSYPDASYILISGTSMAAPHVTGAAALLQSLTAEDLAPSEIRTALRRTTWKPGDCVPSCEPRYGNDTRYGAGIINVDAAAAFLTSNASVTGTVETPSGEPIENAGVNFGSVSFTTDANGTYGAAIRPGEYDVAVEAYGYSSASATVTVPENTTTTTNFTLQPSLEGEIQSQPVEGITDSQQFTIEYKVANVDEVTINGLGGTEAVDYSEMDLTVNGEAMSFGDTMTFDGYTGTLTVTVEPGYGETGLATVEAVLSGEGETKTLTAREVRVVDDFTTVGLVDTQSFYSEHTLETLNNNLSPRFKADLISPEAALDNATSYGGYDVYVVQNFGEDFSDSQVDTFVEATSGSNTGVVYLDQWGGTNSYSDGIARYAQVTGNPETIRNGPNWAYTPISYEIRADHPILQGVGEPGDTVEIHSVQQGKHMWFEDYSGNVIADVSTGEKVKGSALATDYRDRTVLAGTLGRSFYSLDHQFTAKADKILTNAVEWSSSAPPVVVQNEQDRHVEPGEDVINTFSVTNLTRLTVTMDESSTVSKENVSLYVDGNIAAFGQALAFDNRTTGAFEEFEVRVETDEDAVGSLSLNYDFVARPNDAKNTVSFETGPTAVYEPPINVPEDVESIEAADALAPAGAEIVLADGTYVLETSDSYESSEGFATLNTPDVTLRGAEGADVTLKPANANWDSPYSTLAVEANGVTLEDLSFGGLPEDAPSWQSYRRAAVKVFGEDATVRDVTITDVGGGTESTAALVIGDGARVENATIKNLVSGDDDLAISGIESGIEDITIVDSQIGGNGMVERGVLLDQLNVDDVTVRNNTFDLAPSSPFFGTHAAVMVGGNDPFDHVGYTITNNTISGAQYGVYLYTSNGAEVSNNTITDVTYGVGTNPGAAGSITNNTITGAETGFKFETRLWGNVTAMRNEIDAGVGVHLGGDFNAVESSQVHLRYNDLADADVAFEGETQGETFDARLNYFGPRGDATVEADVAYDPFLTEDPGEMSMPTSELSDTTSIATDLTMDAGQKYALGLPGPVTMEPVDVFGEDFQGAMYGFDEETQSWTLVTAEDGFESLQAVVVVPEEDTRAVLNFQSEQLQPPGQFQLTEGWNFVSAPQFGGANEVFGMQGDYPAMAMAKYSQPDSQLGPRSGLSGTYSFSQVDGTGPSVSAFTGYFVFVHDDADAYTLPGHLQANPDVSQLYTQLGIEDEMEMNTGSAGEVSEQTADAVLQRVANETAAAAADETNSTAAVEAAVESALQRVARDMGVSLTDDEVEQFVSGATGNDSEKKAKSYQSPLATVSA